MKNQSLVVGRWSSATQLAFDFRLQQQFQNSDFAKR